MKTLNTAPPEDWVDEVAVERTLRRRPVGRKLTTAEKHAVVREILARGQGVSEVSKVLRTNSGNASRLVEEAGRDF